MARKKEESDESILNTENNLISGPQNPGVPQVRAAAFGGAVDELENPEPDMTDKPGIDNGGTR